MPVEPVLPSLSDPPPPGSRTVRTDDGVDLHVEVDENPDSDLTVVLAHGFTARLAGHSMGGMSVMALARQRPELFGSRVVGVFLLATSAGGLVDSGLLGRAVKVVRRLGLLSLYLWLLQALAPFIERHRRRGTLFG